MKGALKGELVIFKRPKLSAQISELRKEEVIVKVLDRKIHICTHKFELSSRIHKQSERTFLVY
jgi:hypothetical protein